MKVSTIKTHPITRKDNDIYAILDRYVTYFEDYSILAITSKIVSICQGRIIKIDGTDKNYLIEQEADYFLPHESSKYDVSLTIKDNILIPMAGVDESNGDGYYILWPAGSQGAANEVRGYLQKRFVCQNIGVIITDSKTMPLRAGVTGVAIAHSGFLALNDYIGTMDVFGHALRMTQVDVADALATAAVLVMGEGSEQTPLAILGDLSFVTFQERNPSAEELQQLRMDPNDDLFAPLLQGVTWRQGRQ